MTIRLLGAILGTATLAPPGAAPTPMVGQQSVKTSLVLEGVTVVDVDGGKLTPGQRVIITGNRITALGSPGAVKLPHGAQVVAAQGKYLIPGLWDSHVHPMHAATDIYYPLFVAFGITGVRNASSDVPLDTLRRWRQEILAGTRIGPPRQILVGPALAELGSLPCPDQQVAGLAQNDYLNIYCLGLNDAVRVVDSLKAAGADMIKMYTLGETVYFAVAAEARRQGLPFGGHLGVIYPSGEIPFVAPTPMPSAMAASDSGARIIDHSQFAAELSLRCLGAWGSTASLATCEPLAVRLRRNGTWWQPTFVTMMEDIPELGDLAFGERTQAIYEQEAAQAAAFFRGDTAWNRPTGGKLPSAGASGVLTIPARAGVPLLAGTDVIPVWQQQVMPGLSLHTELALFVSEGLPSLTALQSATLNPAKALHATDSLGTVAAGKLADLVLLDADPLTDITNTMTIRAVVANGRYFDRVALDDLLRAVRQRVQAAGQTP